MDIYLEFLEKTTQPYAEENDQKKGAPQPPLQLSLDSYIEMVSLPEPESIKRLSESKLVDVINSRRSVRQYSEAVLSLEELTYLLWCTQGVQQKETKMLRTVPSAGSRHPFETYLLITKVSGLKPGLYRYLALEHKLALILEGADLQKRLVDACYGQGFLGQNAVTFIWVAVTYRMNWRYGARGYRYMFIEAGHVAQNLFLSAESIACGTCAIGKYSDDEMNKILGLDGQEQFVIYMASVGKKR